MSGMKMFQVSTLQALALGYSKAVITVEELLTKGDIGLGTFENVDGEMIMVEGRCYQAMEDGTVVPAEPNTGVPFSSVASYRGEGEDFTSFEIEGIPDMAKLAETLTLKIEEDFALNSMHMAQIDGRFSEVIARSESAYRSQHVELKDILSETQKEFVFNDIEGTLVCVYYPDYMDGINAPGWHIHFISKDRTKGGHVFNIRLDRAGVKLNRINTIEILLPSKPDFDTYTLKEASASDIKKVEQGDGK